ncbi:MAG: pitrilysin family protein [Anaerolineae bacterium]
MAHQTLSLPGPDNITRVTLQNGITVLVYENFAAQSVVISGVLNAGTINDPAEKAGLASMTAAALMRGTHNRDFNTIHESLENIGADVGVSAGAHKANFFGKSLAEDLPVLVDILGDVLRHPVFPAAHIERLRGEIITGLQYRQHDTRYRADRAFRESLYPATHPYHQSRSGTLQTIPTIKVDDLQSFHSSIYGPQGMIVVVVGAVMAKDAVEIVRARLEDWQNPAQPAEKPLPELRHKAKAARVNVTVQGKTQSDIVLGGLGPSRYAEDYQASSIANSILGQFGMMGRIGRIVREELGLAYYAYSRIEGGYGPGPWSVAAGVNPANVDLAIDRIQKELRVLITELVSDEDLEDNKSYYTGHLPLQLENNEGLASVILNMETYGLGLDYVQSYRDTIYRLTKENLLAAAQHYLKPDALVVAVAGPN